MTDVMLRAEALGRRFGRTWGARARWALRGCSLELPGGTITALVGPSGAGKTTLLKLATGLLAPSRWDATYAKRLVDDAGLAPTDRIGTLSGGQRARVGLALALGRRPDLLLLDEPLADLDPLARRQVMQSLLAEVVETGMTVLMSSHVVSDLEDVCDHLVLLRDGCPWLTGGIEDLLAGHRLLTGPDLPLGDGLVHRSVAGRQVTALVRATHSPPGFTATPPTLEDLVLGYLQAPADPAATAVPA